MRTVELRNAHTSILRRGTCSILGWVSLAGLYLLALGGTAARALGGKLEAPWPAAIALVAFAAFAFAWIFRIRGGNHCDVRVHPDRVEIVRGPFTRSFTRSRIVGGLVLAGAQGAEVELQLRGGNAVRVRCKSVAEAEGLVEALGLDPENRRVAIGPGRDTPTSLWMSLFASATALLALEPMRQLSAALALGGFGFVVWVAGSTACALALARALSPPQVVVGLDGVVVHWLFGKRFIPHAELERAERVPSEGLVLSLSGGERLRLGARNAGGEYIDALCARIQAARAAALGASVATSAVPLERDGRTLARWREALRAVVRLRVALDGIGQDSVDEAAIEEALAADADRDQAARQ